jgi:hypothetical protein
MNLIVVGLIIFTFLILLAGVVIMASGNQKMNLKYSNKLMSLRVIFQAIAIALLALIYVISKK